MKIGLIGSGGREHALACALTRNTARDSLFVFAGSKNPGIQRIARDVFMGDLKNTVMMTEYFARHGVDFVVIGPEGPLTAGAADELRAHGIPTVGPSKSQARLEGDKGFMRQLLRDRVGWGSPAWKVVTSAGEAHSFIERTGEVAVKPLGLTGGKGVRVMGVHLHSVEEAVADAESLIRKDGSVLLEERLVGEEFSRMVFVADGKLAPMPVAQDFKYAYDGENGNMTGGMGAYTFANGSMPFINTEDLSQADRLLVEVVEALEKETGQPYRGFLYGQFMVTANGPRVIEFNVRLGDPEGINEMLLFDGDASLFLAGIASGKIDSDLLSFQKKASVVKYMVPADYPDNTPDPVDFSLEVDKIEQSSFSVIYASVQRAGKDFQTLGSRTIAVAKLDETPEIASGRIEELLSVYQPAVLRHRKDVGDAQVIQRKIDRMNVIKKGRKIA